MPTSTLAAELRGGSRRSSMPASAARPAAASSCSIASTTRSARRFSTRVAKVKVGSGPDDDCGPVISRANLDRLIAQVERRGRRAARRSSPAAARSPSLAPGYYMQPTVLENVSPDDEVSQQELFGPVTCLYRVGGFRRGGAPGQRHALRPDRRDSHHQPASRAGIHRALPGRAGLDQRRDLRRGPHMPFGGVKNSGNGFREPGTEALDVYTELKTVVINHVPGGCSDGKAVALRYAQMSAETKNLFSDHQPRLLRAQPAADPEAARASGHRSRS